MNRTKIETADYTWNPVTGCDNVCFGGDCYAYQLVKRYGKAWGYGWEPTLHQDRLGEPNKLLDPSVIFGPSMGDICSQFFIHNGITQMFLDEIKKTPWHRFMVQSKMAEQFPAFKYPSNVWLGVSLCYSQDVKRLDYLRQTNARVKYAYCEPLLEEIHPDFTGIDWVVIGALTGAHAKQPQADWVSDLIQRAKAVNAAVFLKSNLTFFHPIRDYPDKGWVLSSKSKLRLQGG